MLSPWPPADTVPQRTATQPGEEDPLAANETDITNLLAREPFRHVSLTGSVCKGSIMGLGADGYRLAILHLLDLAGSKAAGSN